MRETLEDFNFNISLHSYFNGTLPFHIWCANNEIDEHKRDILINININEIKNHENNIYWLNNFLSGANTKTFAQFFKYNKSNPGAYSALNWILMNDIDCTNQFRAKQKENQAHQLEMYFLDLMEECPPSDTNKTKNQIAREARHTMEDQALGYYPDIILKLW